MLAARQVLFGLAVDAGGVSGQLVVGGVESLLGAWRRGDPLWELPEG